MTRAQTGGEWDEDKRSNLCITGIPEGEEKGRGAESVLGDIMAENPQIWQQTNLQIQKPK